MSNFYSLGRGEFHFSPFINSLTQVEKGFRFLGNAPEATLSREVETLDHFSSTDSVRRKDYSIPLSSALSGTITLDEIRTENLAYFVGGVASTVSTASGTGKTSTFAASKGLTYQLGVSDATPAGLVNVSNVVVTGGAGPTTYVVTEDYLVDAARGTITITENSDITEGQTVTVTFNHGAYSRSQVASNVSYIEGALRFYSKAPSGPRHDWYFPWVRMTPNGDFNLITEEWQTIPFTLEVMKKGALAEVYVSGEALAS